METCPKCGNHTEKRICPKCGFDTMSSNSIKDSVSSVVAKGACKITGHKWVGCKCTRCGEVRDTEHDFQSVPNKCQEKCSVCEKTIDIEHQYKNVENSCIEECVVCGSKRKTEHHWKNDTCEICGAKKSIIDSTWDIISDKLPFLHLEKKKNRNSFLIGLSVIFFILFFGILGIIESTPDSDGNIRLPYVLSNFNEENYNDVISELEDAGFTNVKTIAKGDLILGWLNKEGEVASVTVGGTTEFDSSDRYPVDTEIIIEYHSFTTEDVNDDQTANVEDSKENDKETTTDTNQESETEEYIYTGQQYEVVDSYETGIGLTQFWVYTSKFDLSTEEYKLKAKEIITDLVKKSMTTDIIVVIATDKEIIYFESDNTIAEYMNKYGDKYYRDTIVPKEKEGLVAYYTGGFDSNTSKLSTADSAYELIWFIASDDPEFENWKPELISR